MTATKGAAALGLDAAAVVALVQALTARDFDKSMTSHVSSRIWQDVYKPDALGRTLYIKFTKDHDDRYLLISFKEA